MELTPDLVPLTAAPMTDAETRTIRRALDVEGIPYAVHPPHRFLLEGDALHMSDQVLGSHTVYVRPQDVALASGALLGTVPRYLLTAPPPARTGSTGTTDDLVPLCELPWEEAFGFAETLVREGVSAAPRANEGEASSEVGDRRATVVVRRGDLPAAEAAARRLLGGRFVPFAADPT